MRRIAPALFACFVVFACSFSFAGSLIKNPPHTNVTRTTGGYNYSMNPSTTYKVLGSETTPSRVAPTSAGTSLMMAEEQAATWPNGAMIDATLETAITGDEIASTLASAAMSGKVTPAGLVGNIAAQFVINALITEGMQWLDSQKAWVKYDPSAPPTIPGAQYADACAAARAAGVSNVGDSFYWDRSPTRIDQVFVYGFGQANPYPQTYSLNCGLASGTKNLGGNLLSTGIPSKPTLTATEADIKAAINDQLAKNVNAATWDAAFNDATAVAPSTNVAQGSRPQVVTINTPSQTSSPKQISQTTTTNPDGSTTTSTTNSTTTTTAAPSGSTVNNTSTNVTSTTTNVTNVTNNTTNTTTTSSTTTPDNSPPPDPTPSPTPDPAIAPPAVNFPPVPPPTPVPDSPPSAQTSFLSWSPFASFSFACTDPSVPILDKNVSIPLCQWIEKIRVFFFWFWNVATAIGIYLLGRGFNINTASAKTEE